MAAPSSENGGAPTALGPAITALSTVPPPPRTRNRAGSAPHRQRSLTASQVPTFTAGTPLGKTSSRLSTHTYVDAAMVAPGLNELMREDTRVSVREKRERERVRDVEERIGEAEEKEGSEKGTGHAEDAPESRRSSEVLEEIPYPDGGLQVSLHILYVHIVDSQAWLVLGGAFAGAVCAYGMVAAWGAWQSFYASELLSSYPRYANNLDVADGQWHNCLDRFHSDPRLLWRWIHRWPSV